MASESASGRALCGVSAGSPCRRERQLSRCRFTACTKQQRQSLPRASRAAPQLMQFPGLILVQPELSPQINPTDLFVRRQARGRPAFEDDAVVDDVGAVSNAQRFTDVVIGDEDANSAIAQ